MIINVATISINNSMENNKDAYEKILSFSQQYFEDNDASEDVGNTLLKLIQQLKKRPSVSTEQLYNTLSYGIKNNKNDLCLWIFSDGEINTFSVSKCDPKEPLYTDIKFISEETASNIIHLLYRPKPTSKGLLYIAQNLNLLCSHQNHKALLFLIDRILENTKELIEKEILFKNLDQKKTIKSYTVTKIDHPTISDMYLDQIEYVTIANEEVTAIQLKNTQLRLKTDQCYYFDQKKLYKHIRSKIKGP